MFLQKSTSLIVSALGFCLVFTSVCPIAIAQKKTAPVEATPPPTREEFKFGEVDLEILEQSVLLDNKLERDGLVLHDEAANAYVRRIGRSLVPMGVGLERVLWNFGVLVGVRANVFGFLYGSI